MSEIVSGSSKITNLSDHKILKDIAEQTGLTKSNSNIVQALQEAQERGEMYHALDVQAAKDLFDQGKEPCPCHNQVCDKYNQYSEDSDRTNWCSDEVRSHSCLFNMLEPPPNSLNYDEGMPSHKAALTRLEELGLLKGQMDDYKLENDRYRRVSRSERNQTEIKGVTMDLMCEVIETTIQDLIDNPYVPEDEKVGLDQNKGIIARNATVEMEKSMGIYPNIRSVKK
jgi:hypothetical protein